MWVQRARTLAFCVLALMVAASIGMLLAAKPAHADNFTVNSLADTGDQSGDQSLGDGFCNTEPVRVDTAPECTLRADGSLVYNSNLNFAGVDTFYYRAFDGKALSNQAKVTIRVRAVAG
jgi:CSLREA domain-containing protein